MGVAIMKTGIARRLSLYFLAVILVFSMVIGGIFNYEFRSHTVEIYKENLMTRADNIASTYSVTGDYDRLRQLLNILLDNAVKFTPTGKKITVLAKNKDKGLMVSVIDEGCGMPPDMISHIFDRFYRAQNSLNKSGTGLGLAIAKQIAERQNIQINVSSIEGNGTTFELYIPITEYA
jgi:signal transduction histidine kinase